MHKLLPFLLLPLVAPAQNPTPPTPFQDITSQVGISHQFKVYGGMFGGGAYLLDVNRDGFEDLFIRGGMNEDALYLNNGNQGGRHAGFTNVYAQSGLTTRKRPVSGKSPHRGPE